MKKEDGQPYQGIEEWMDDVNSVVPDADVYTDRTLTLKSWWTSIKPAWENTMTCYKKHGWNWWKIPSLFNKQWYMVAWIHETVQSCKYYDKIDWAEMRDGHCSKMSELMYTRGDYGSVPLRALRIQSLMQEHNESRNKLLQARARPHMLGEDEFKQSMELCADEYYTMPEDFNVMRKAAEGFMEHISVHGKVSYGAQPWTFMAAISIFVTDPQNPWLFWEEPALIIPFEVFDGMNEHEMSEVLTEAMGAASEYWILLDKKQKESQDDED